jgi:hypothetical protein
MERGTTYSGMNGPDNVGTKFSTVFCFHTRIKNASLKTRRFYHADWNAWKLSWKRRERSSVMGVIFTRLIPP